MASSSERRSGAKPPSSPTPAERPFSFSWAPKVWVISAHHRSPSRKLSAPTGTTINSWMSMLFPAWAPPFKMFIMGVGSRWAPAPPKNRNKGIR